VAPRGPFRKPLAENEVVLLVINIEPQVCPSKCSMGPSL
jgi:hypothetical protein